MAVPNMRNCIKTLSVKQNIVFRESGKTFKGCSSMLETCDVFVTNVRKGVEVTEQRPYNDDMGI